MTIKKFSQLCGCNPQTLRYYDHMDLLKPVEVDPWTGYRYYDKKQALVYVKIKDLQMAGFSIDEIKSLLNADNDAICDAIEKKISEQEERLKRTIEIQQSYLGDMQNMKEKITQFFDRLSDIMMKYDPTEEFGISKDKYREITDSVLNTVSHDAKNFEFSMQHDSYDSNEESNYLSLLDDPNFEVVYEQHEWNNVRDFIDQINIPAEENDYVLLFTLSKSKKNQSAFANTALAVILGERMLGNNSDTHEKQRFGCNVTFSGDGKNHFWLLRSRREHT